MKIAAHARTDVGRWRPANEDAHIVLDRARVFAVADGMGGHAAGEIASRIAVDVIASLAQQHYVAQLYRLYLDEGGEPVPALTAKRELD